MNFRKNPGDPGKLPAALCIFSLARTGGVWYNKILDCRFPKIWTAKRAAENTGEAGGLMPPCVGTAPWLETRRPPAEGAFDRRPFPAGV